MLFEDTPNWLDISYAISAGLKRKKIIRRKGAAGFMETDEQIYLRYTETDDDADLEALLVRYREGLLLFLLGFVRNAEDAEQLQRLALYHSPQECPHAYPEKAVRDRSFEREHSV